MTHGVPVYVLSLTFVLCNCKEQRKTDLPKETGKSESKTIITSPGPKLVTRTIRQDRKGYIWMAAWDGVFRYDGKAFTNITSGVSSARFFSVLEDRKGNFWFSTVGSGVFYYDGSSFRNYTTRDGLASDRTSDIYEDKTGNIWFGTEGGASYYDGRSFRNFTTKDGLPNNDVGSIIEDRTGKFWFGTRSDACVYDGKKFTVLIHNGKPFRNVRTIIEDKKGAVWLAGQDGLWRYDGNTFSNFRQKDVGYVYEDNEGNIWTISARDNAKGWAVSRYDEKSLSDKKPTVTEFSPKGKNDLEYVFGILEDRKGNMWFSANGVYRFDGITFYDFKNKEAQKYNFP